MVAELGDEDLFVELHLLEVEDLFVLEVDGFFVLDEETFFEEHGVLVDTIFLVDEAVGEGFFVELIAFRVALQGVLLGVEVTLAACLPRGRSVSVVEQTVVSVVLDACQLRYYAQRELMLTRSRERLWALQ